MIKDQRNISKIQKHKLQRMTHAMTNLKMIDTNNLTKYFNNTFQILIHKNVNHVLIIFMTELKVLNPGFLFKLFFLTHGLNQDIPYYC